MPSTSPHTGLYWTSSATSGSYLSLMDGEIYASRSSGTNAHITYEFTLYGNNYDAIDLLSNTGAIHGANCHYITESITATVTQQTVRVRMCVSETNTELHNLMLSATDGDLGATQILQYIACSDTTNYLSAVLSGNAIALTEEEREALKQIRREREIALEQDIIRKNIAKNKAINLLWTHLSAVQKRSLKRYGWFEVMSKCGIRYRLLYTLHGNVLRMSKDNKVEQAFCGHMGNNIPIADTLLAQKLLLRHNPQKYESSANKVNFEHTSWCRPQKGFKDEIVRALESPVTKEYVVT